jgi:hypothetical protein
MADVTHTYIIILHAACFVENEELTGPYVEKSDDASWPTTPVDVSALATVMEPAPVYASTQNKPWPAGAPWLPADLVAIMPMS